MADTLITEAEQIRATNKAAEVDITDLAKKHIPVNASKKDVEIYLRAQDFTLHDQPKAPDNTQTLVAVRKEKGLIARVGFHDEIRVIVTFDNEKVKQASAKIIYRSL